MVWLPSDTDPATLLIAGLLGTTLLTSGLGPMMFHAVRLWTRRSLVRVGVRRLQRATASATGVSPRPNLSIRTPGPYADAAMLATVTMAITATACANGQAVEVNLLLGTNLLLAALIDLRWYWLPDRLTLPLAAIGILAALLGGDGASSLFGVGLAGGMLLGLRWGYRLLSGTDGLGLGDVKLAAAMGAWLPPECVLAILVHAALAGSAFGILLMLARGRKSASTIRLPFGPFMICVFWLGWMMPPA